MKKLEGLNKKQKLVKRTFDFVFATIGLLVLIIPILILIIIATFSTGKWGLFSQLRVGKNGKLFTIYKIRTMHNNDGSSIVLKNDIRITNIGRVFRKHRLDELPQLFNVLIGNMSFVGPRPDVVGYADKLKGNDYTILSVKPGITGPATIKFKNEDILLENQNNPKQYNDEVIWKEKVKINKKYIQNWSFTGDVKYIFTTVFS